MVERDRDLSDPTTRSSAGAQCLVQYRDEMDARGEVDDWDWYTTVGRVIDGHASRVIEQIFRRVDE